MVQNSAIDYSKRRLYPALYLTFSLLIYIIGAAALALVSTRLPGSPLTSMLCSLALWSAIAVVLSLNLKLPRSWQIVNGLLPWGTAASVVYPGASNWIVPLIVAGFLLYLPTFWTRVPYFPTSPLAYPKVAELLPTDRDFRFVDLGCGNARLLIYLARRFKNGSFEGYEISPLAFTAAWLLALIFGKGRVKIRYKSFWAVNLTPYDFVYAFLSPDPMEALWEKVRAELGGNGVFISNTFACPIKAHSEIVLEDSRQTNLYIYKTST